MADVYRPYSDGQMDYDATRHRYRLTHEYVLNELGIDLDSQLASGNAADRGRNPGIFLRRISDQIYGVVYSTTPYRFGKERQLALSRNFRDTLRDAMSEQVVYILQNGDPSAYAGVDAVAYQSVERERLEQARIAPMALDLLVSSGIISLGYRSGRDITPDYDREGY